MLDFHDFHARVVLTGLKHDATNYKHPDDNKIRKHNKLSKNKVYQNYKIEWWKMQTELSVKDQGVD